jgi:hypothetical protein
MNRKVFDLVIDSVRIFLFGKRGHVPEMQMLNRTRRLDGKGYKMNFAM